jgi:hypothetical protein
MVSCVLTRSPIARAGYLDTLEARSELIPHNLRVEPQIQYCTTSDGVSIAYYVRGTGPTLVATITSWESISPRTKMALQPGPLVMRWVDYVGHVPGYARRVLDHVVWRRPESAPDFD